MRGVRRCVTLREQAMADRIQRTRAAENQRLFREVNERTKGVQDTFGYFVERASWVCECSDVRCLEPIWMTIPEYEWVRADPRHFVVVRGHGDDAVERAIVDAGRFTVVELREPPAREPSELLYYYRLGPEPGFEYVGEVATQWVGYTPDEHYADPELGQKLIHPDDRAVLQAIAARPDLSPIRIRWLTRDGRLLVTEHRLAAVREDEADAVAVAGRATLVR
jgi:PAS domain-containing protein